MTKIRAKANRNIVDVDEIRAQKLVAAGIFEYVESEAQRARRAQREAPTPPEALGPQEQPQEQPEQEAPSPRQPVDFESKTKAELEELVGDLEVEGTGKGGYVTKEDLVRALERRYMRRDLRAED